MSFPFLIKNESIALISSTSSHITQLLEDEGLKCESTNVQLKYPAKVINNSYGKCYVAISDIEPNTVLEKFVGPVLKFEKIPDDEICYAACNGDGTWVIPLTNARYINHSCDPNCVINKNGEVCSIRHIKAGEEITFDYVTISKEEYLKNPDEYFWDERWTFECQCGSSKCRKKIDRYFIDE